MRLSMLRRLLLIPCPEVQNQRFLDDRVEFLDTSGLAVFHYYHDWSIGSKNSDLAYDNAGHRQSSVALCMEKIGSKTCDYDEDLNLNEFTIPTVEVRRSCNLISNNKYSVYPCRAKGALL